MAKHEKPVVVVVEGGIVQTVFRVDASKRKGYVFVDYELVDYDVVKLGSTAHAGFGDLAKPFRTVAQRVDLLTGTGDGPASVQRLESIQDPREIFGDRQIAAF